MSEETFGFGDGGFGEGPYGGGLVDLYEPPPIVETTLVNGEFFLRDLYFGTEDSGYPLVPGGFVVEPVHYRSQDRANPVGDGRVFGRDYYDGITYSWTLQINEEGEFKWQRAAERLERFRETWQGSRTRLVPGEVDELHLWHGSEPGVVYGRTRDYAPHRHQLRKGLAKIDCTFAASDDKVYSETQEEKTIQLINSEGGGLVAPLTAPLVATGETRRGGFVTIGGRASTHAVITFRGPASNPRLKVGNLWTVGLNGTLNYDDAVIVDARLWHRSVLRNGLASVAGWLTRETPSLNELLLEPGTHEMVYTGVDPTNTSTATVTWRNARYSV